MGGGRSEPGGPRRSKGNYYKKKKILLRTGGQNCIGLNRAKFDRIAHFGS